MDLVKKRENREERLYLPIKNALERELKEYLNSQRERIGPQFTGKVHSEITANGHFPEELKEVLDNEILHIIRVEKFSPDLMGFIEKTQYQKELITIEVKDEKISIQSISRAKLYADIFNAKYGMLISTQGIGTETERFISNRWAIRGNVIIAQFHEANNNFSFDKRLYSTIPEPFDPREIKTVPLV
ncbi:MAG: hypothetical protein WCD81_11480 [Candidatus Bathyarchaeia archaeon]